MLEEHAQIFQYMDLLAGGLIAGAVAHAWINIVTKEGMVLGFIKKFILKLNLPQWITNPIIGCSICNAGQIALWYYVISNFGLGLISIHTLEVIPFIAIAIVTAQRLDT